MAVPKRKTSPSRRNMRRSHDALTVQARERGLPVSIHRLRSVTGDHEHALCNPTDFLWQLALMGAAMQALPDIDLPLNLTPVDDVARAVVTVMTTPDLPAQVYHLLGPRTLRLLDVAPVLADLGLEPRVVSMQEWRTIAQAHLKDRVDDDLLAILAILSKYDHRHAGARARPRMPAGQGVDSNQPKGGGRL